MKAGKSKRKHLPPLPAGGGAAARQHQFMLERGAEKEDESLAREPCDTPADTAQRKQGADGSEQQASG